MDLLSDDDRAMMDTLIRRAHDLACHLQDEAMACDDLTEKRKLAADFHRVSRAFRQTLALKVKVLREDAEARKAAAADETAARREAERARVQRARDRVQAHRERVETVLEALIHERYDWDPDEAEPDLDRLSHLLDVEELREGFLDVPADTLIHRLGQRLDMTITLTKDHPPPNPSPSGEGQTAQPSGWGSVDPP